MYKKLLITFLLGLTPLGYSSVKPGFEFTLGATSFPLSSVTSNVSAKKDLAGELYNPMGFKYNFKGSGKYQFSAVLSTTKLSLITNKDKDGGSKNYLTQLGGDIFFDSTSNWNFITQFGILQHEIKGSGGNVELRNGTSTTLFILPNKTVNSQVVYFGAGAHYDFGPINLETNLDIISLFSSTRRSYFITILLGIPL